MRAEAWRMADIPAPTRSAQEPVFRESAASISSIETGALILFHKLHPVSGTRRMGRGLAQEYRRAEPTASRRANSRAPVSSVWLTRTNKSQEQEESHVIGRNS